MLNKVVVKVALRGEGFVAVGVGAVVGSFARMQAHMSFEVALFIERFATALKRADEIADSAVLLQMDF